ERSLARGDLAIAAARRRAARPGMPVDAAVLAAGIALAQGDPAGAVAELERAAAALPAAASPDAAAGALAAPFLRAARPDAAPDVAIAALRGQVAREPGYHEWRLLLARALRAN